MIKINELSPEKADEYLISGALLIDVREKEEVLQISFDVLNVRNTAYSIFDENYMDIPKDRTLIVACHLGIRSERVAQFLIVQGWNADNIFSLKGGMDAWLACNLPVKKAARTFSMAKTGSSGCCGNNSSSSCC